MPVWPCFPPKCTVWRPPHPKRERLEVGNALNPCFTRARHRRGAAGMFAGVLNNLASTIIS